LSELKLAATLLTANHRRSYQRRLLFIKWYKTGSPMAIVRAFTRDCTNMQGSCINAFIVEKLAGVVVGAKENKLGIRGSDTQYHRFVERCKST
jgi:alkylation response protein AidB-like acyl-CoA dehydrogenase